MNPPDPLSSTALFGVWWVSGSRWRKVARSLLLGHLDSSQDHRRHRLRQKTDVAQTVYDEYVGYAVGVRCTNVAQKCSMCMTLSQVATVSCDFFLRWVGPPLAEGTSATWTLVGASAVWHSRIGFDRRQDMTAQYSTVSTAILAQQHIEAYPCHGVSIFRNWHFFPNW